MLRLGAAFFAIVNAYFLTKGLQHYEAFFMITTVEGALHVASKHMKKKNSRKTMWFRKVMKRIVLHDLYDQKLNVHNRFNDSVSQPFWCDRLTRCLWIARLEDCIVFSVGHGGDSRYLGNRKNVKNGKRRWSPRERSHVDTFAWGMAVVFRGEASSKSSLLSGNASISSWT